MAELAGVMVGNYFLLECLSREGMVETYRARPTTRGGYDVILRLYRPQFPDPTGFRDAFASEVEKVWRCQHPHIQPLLEYGTGADLLYSVSPLPEDGETLETLLARQPEHVLPLPLVLRFVTQTCAALQYAHEHNIVHGNIQPSSILVSDEEEVRITNFGMRRIYHNGDPLTAEIDMGNAAYMAPEQSLGIVYPASDIYAVGVLLFRLLTGQLPYDGDSAGEIAMRHTDAPIPSLRALRPDLPEELELVVRVALSKSPDARFPGTADLAQALISAVVPDAPQIIPDTPERRVSVHARRTRFTWARAASFLALLMLIFGLVSASIFVFSSPQHLHQISNLPFLHHGATVTTTTATVPGTAPPGTVLTPTVEITGPGSGSNPGVGPANNATPPASGHQPPTPQATPTPPVSTTPAPTPTATATPGPSSFTCTAGSFSIAAPSNLAPLLQYISNDYQSACPGTTIALGGSTDRKNLNAVAQNQATLAACDLTALPQRNLSDFPLAASLYALIASPDVQQINGLSSAQIQAIYQGKLTNWSQLGGPNERVSIILRPASDAVNALFRSFVLNGAPIHVRGYRLKQDTPSLVVQAVSQVAGAISIVPLVAAQGANVQVLAIDSVLPTAQNLLNGSYAFWGVDHLYTEGAATAQAQSYLQFIASGQEASVMIQLDAVPVNAIPQAMLASHLPGPEI